MKIGVIDYDAGNLRSVETALQFISCNYQVSSQPEELADSDKLIFPGVGEANQAMGTLHKSGLDQFLKEFAKSGKPILGICLGFQILLSHSEESDTNCLDLVPGKVIRFPYDLDEKVPHMGWNTISFSSDNKIFTGIPNDTSCYFVHSFYADLTGTDYSLCETEYGVPFTSGLHHENILGFQFHPEKSGKYGLQLLKNYIELFGE